MDTILERHEKGLCPICNRMIQEDFKIVVYKGKKVWVCPGHEGV